MSIDFFFEVFFFFLARRGLRGQWESSFLVALPPLFSPSRKLTFTCSSFSTRTFKKPAKLIPKTIENSTKKS